ncbi:condensin complex subunit 2/barren [Lophiotrema nucula]|uniref:Condensin complex subunit 2 n=1 Tax=Lophiotrema nucula TaxID=690887 RepID=A0A6A5YSG3_9PLEO|nr:condensin complex subunit 2/barren [Lophiotrema nucula]
MPRQREKLSIAATPRKSPVKVPLNDDRQEKANRLHQRQARQHAQLDSIRASATPARRRISLAANSPHTPANDDVLPDVAGTAITPMKRTAPLLANFEEWMKLATDNKINANNSWNFALIDYFHDMSLLKEGDGVNFQKASCTLDGCVKIYTSRVDSVATDTGKLLSGLAEGNKSRRGADADAEGDDDDEEGEDGQKKKKKKAQRSAEATLASSFAQLQNKKMELEFSVDPLFKKASADFDEGGAKGLLLNHLAIDPKGRIVFDSSDDAQDASEKHSRETPAPESPEAQQSDAMDVDEEPNEDVEVDISGLAARFFPNLAALDEQDVCPSLKTFDLADTNATIDLPFMKAPEDLAKDDNHEGEGNQSGIVLNDDNAMGFDDDDGGIADYELPPETGFGEGGEAWIANQAALEPQARVRAIGLGEGIEDGGDDTEDGAVDAAGRQYGLSIAHGRVDEAENILSYFDQALRKNWAGPEHWRIRRIKDIGKAAPTTKRKEKEPFEINFAAPMTQAIADALYTPASSNTTIQLPRAQWKSKSRNLLPDDKHFNSRQLLQLFLKPRARLGARSTGGQKQHQQQRPDINANGEIGEDYWALRNEENALGAEADGAQGNYDGRYFDEDALGPTGPSLDDDADDFRDALDHFSSPPEEGAGPAQMLDGVLAGSQEGAFGTQLVTQSRRFRPEYVQYARVAKKVDVRRLKEELWRGTGLENIQAAPQPEAIEDPAAKAVDGSLKFTQMINNLQQVYLKPQMADISTSYCFICLLHLANEKGLEISEEPDFTELTVRKDFKADLSVGD